MAAGSAHKLRIFCAYSAEDEKLRAQLEQHLSQLKRSYSIELWHYQHVLPGTSRQAAHHEALSKADVVLLLFSPSFITSDFCYSDQLEVSVARHLQRTATVVPVILRPCDWQATPARDLQPLPRRGRPITMWSNRDQAYQEVADGLKAVLDHLTTPLHDDRPSPDGQHSKEPSLPSHVQLTPRFPAPQRAKSEVPPLRDIGSSPTVPQQNGNPTYWILCFLLNVVWAAVAIWQSAPWAVVLLGIAVLAFFAFVIALRTRRAAIGASHRGAVPRSGILVTLATAMVTIWLSLHYNGCLREGKPHPSAVATAPSTAQSASSPLGSSSIPRTLHKSPIAATGDGSSSLNERVRQVFEAFDRQGADAESIPMLTSSSWINVNGVRTGRHKGDTIDTPYLLRRSSPSWNFSCDLVVPYGDVRCTAQPSDVRLRFAGWIHDPNCLLGFNQEDTFAFVGQTNMGNPVFVRWLIRSRSNGFLVHQPYPQRSMGELTGPNDACPKWGNIWVAFVGSDDETSSLASGYLKLDFADSPIKDSQVKVFLRFPDFSHEWLDLQDSDFDMLEAE